MRGLQGSHTTLVLLEHGYKVTTVDNLDNAFEEVFRRLKKLAGDKAEHLDFVKARLKIGAPSDTHISNDQLQEVFIAALGRACTAASHFLLQADLRNFEELDTIFSKHK